MNLLSHFTPIFWLITNLISYFFYHIKLIILLFLLSWLKINFLKKLNDLFYYNKFLIEGFISHKWDIKFN